MKKGRNIGIKSLKYIAAGVLLFSLIGVSGCDKKNGPSKEEPSAETQKQINDLKAEIEELKKQYAELEALKKEVEDNKNADIAELTTQVNSLTTIVNNLNSQITTLQTQIQNLNNTIDSLEGDKTDLIAAKEALEAQLTTLQQQKSEADALITQLNNQIAELEQTIADFENYTINFDSNGGSSVKTQVVRKDEVVTKPTNPTRTGYTFQYWYYGEESNEWDFFTGVTSNMTLTAKWTANEYTVTFDINGGNAMAQTVFTYTYDQSYTLPTGTKTNYTSTGWYNGSQLVGKNGQSVTWKIASNITLKATWAKTNAHITYQYGYEGPADYVQYVTYGSNYTLLSPSRVGYTFDGWKYEGSFIKSGKWEYLDDITVTGFWTAKNYSLTLDPVDGTLVGSDSATVTFDEEYALPVCEDLSEDLPFAGWFLGRTRITDELGNSLHAWDLSEETSYTLEAKYFHPISTKEDFAAIADNPSTIYSLVNDIDFGGVEFEQVESFNGTLYGMDYALKNISFTSDSLTVGLFKAIEGATFENISIKDSVMAVSGDDTSSTLYAGLLASQAFGTNTFRNVTIKNNDISAASSTNKGALGGVVGIAENLVLENISFESEIHGEFSGNTGNIGGFVGECVGNINANSYLNKGLVSGEGLADDSHDLSVGGLVGLARTSNLVDVSNDTLGHVFADSSENISCYAGGIIGKTLNHPSMSNCVNKGEVTSEGFGGGIIGCFASDTSDIFSGCYNEGIVNDNGGSGVTGGLIGLLSVSHIITRVFNKGTVTTTSGYAGGLIGSCTNTLTLYESYNAGSVNASNGAAGGLIGKTQTASLDNCYNEGNVTAMTFAGGILGVCTGTNPTITHSYVSGTISLQNTSVSGKVGGFVGRSVSSILINSFIFANLVGLDGGVNSLVGDFTGINNSNVKSAATLTDLELNPIEESYASVDRVLLTTFTPEYIENELLFNNSIWKIEFDIDNDLYPTLLCFED